MHFFGKGYAPFVTHYSSSDNGLTWTNASTIAEVPTPYMHFELAVNNEAEEGAIYILYRYRGEAFIVLSKDHGKTFGNSIYVGNSDFSSFRTVALDLCGLNGKGIVMSGANGRRHGDSYVRFLPLGYSYFRHLSYPFKRFHNAKLNTATAVCRYMGAKGYSIVFIEAASQKQTYFAHGVLTNPESLLTP